MWAKIVCRFHTERNLRKSGDAETVSDLIRERRIHTTKIGGIPKNISALR